MMESNYVNGEKSMFIIRRVQTNALLTLALATALSFLVATHAYAVTNTANTLKISPVRSDIEVKAGESKTVQTRVTNLTDQPITVHPIENDFISGDERGTPAIILDEAKYAPTHSLKRFMVPLDDVTIEAGKTETITVTINVPQNAQAGGYFGAVRFAPTSPDSGGQVNLSASAASLILLTVPGDLVEKLNMTDFSIMQYGVVGTNFSTSKDIMATVRFENKGGAQIGPFGKVSVKQGNKVIYDVDFNNKTPRDVVLPDGARRWDIPLKNIAGFGKYTVTATFTYGKDNQSTEVTKSFWVIPKEVIIAAIIGLVVLVGLIVVITILVRNRKQHTIRGFGSRHNGRRR